MFGKTLTPVFRGSTINSTFYCKRTHFFSTEMSNNCSAGIVACHCLRDFEMFLVKTSGFAVSTRNLSSLFDTILHRRIHKKCIESVSNAILSQQDVDLLEENVRLRKSHGNVSLLRQIVDRLGRLQDGSPERSALLERLNFELDKLPNQTHPTVMTYGEEPKLLGTYNEYPKFDFKPLPFPEIARKLNVLRMEHLGNFTGHKSYYLMDTLAELEHALTQYALDEVTQNDFDLISVPDILPAEVIEGCGMATSGDRTQVYKLTKNAKCLSGTSEMALAGFFQNTLHEEEHLPKKLTAVSRCFRAETSGLQEEKGIYRVHQFTKVEMFSVCTAKQSDEILEHFNQIELHLFEKLGLHFKLLDMPPYELGAPAYRKYDIEAWMCGRNMWGEISSCSNCTDYQAKRLNIQYRTKDGVETAHTVNGTACAVPRLLIAILETHQDKSGVIHIPKVLQKYLHGQEKITRKKVLPELKLVKSIKSVL